ncbi:hypothetical protein ASPZODRAFT_147025 [Penicilliopsis zonata CBS 506.65]|uniref:Dickkopf N-terminal cysteine-rich domain-containing protein n=1 Tax=Penicilliopsis zonata CBS 506.65 TaxID=1073090 RepID=A0A1L9S6S9_9EURO|nr:hypothetical protein ASPZODRAFT_147025 [Penicilliopsis zonata CBS 506.65]OJJ42859.1 hypothetical protein ASPZODRAFT_147025 [Penicilliopsis zonata CBS 506.65]
MHLSILSLVSALSATLVLVSPPVSASVIPAEFTNKTYLSGMFYGHRPTRPLLNHSWSHDNATWAYSNTSSHGLIRREGESESEADADAESASVPERTRCLSTDNCVWGYTCDEKRGICKYGCTEDEHCLKPQTCSMGRCTLPNDRPCGAVKRLCADHRECCTGRCERLFWPLWKKCEIDLSNRDKPRII